MNGACLAAALARAGAVSRSGVAYRLVPQRYADFQNLLSGAGGSPKGWALEPTRRARGLPERGRGLGGSGGGVCPELRRAIPGFPQAADGLFSLAPRGCALRREGVHEPWGAFAPRLCRGVGFSFRCAWERPPIGRGLRGFWCQAPGISVGTTWWSFPIGSVPVRYWSPFGKNRSGMGRFARYDPPEEKRDAASQS